MNQKDIKFRMWSEVTKQMSPCSTLAGMIRVAEKAATDTPLSPIMPIMTVMQYTGAKDKKGKEIYESDIVQATLPNELGSFSVTKAEVKWCYAANAWHLNKKGFDNCWTFGEKVEVIGNIYEHPNLLNQ